ncbi:methyl-accepting chemotaxis protein [Paenibacillus sp.]|uniref:methyl-accepting chemotaxis protein n=1 Tax=Paenibacillus sp. TaxID=58172 RepID=UPI002D676D66|nr:methyl-accepting chemotaxis protein [Paenibacillus sp.]HZG86661.1 methyl-accepting chemotaxis protein [Paenibacillus sp.]
MNWGTFRLSLRIKLLIVTLSLLIIPTGALGLISYRETTDETNRMVEEGLRNDVRFMLEVIERQQRFVESGTLPKELAQEEIKDMLLGPKLTDGTRPINDRIDLGEHGYMFVLSEDGTALAHPAAEGQSLWDSRSPDGSYFIQDMIAKASNGGGVTRYSWPLPGEEGMAEKLTYAERDPNWGWIVAAGSYTQDFNQGQRNIQRAILVTLCVAIASGALVSFAFAVYLTRPINRVSDLLRLVARGELNAEPVRVRRNDETGRLAEDANAMLQQLRGLVREVADGSGAVLAASHQLASSAEQTSQATRGVAAAVLDIAEGADAQSTAAAESARAMEEVTHGIQRIADIMGVAYESSARTAENAASGGETVELAVRQIGKAVDTVRELSGTIHGLKSRSERIESILQLIADIAKQTNLLSLNASIEAARAGEHGRGFGVVAGEIKKLADQSSRSAEDIRAVVEQIRSDIRFCAESMEHSEREVSEGATLVYRTGDAFRSIDAAAKLVLEQVEEATAASEQMSAGAEEVAASLQDIAGLSSRAASATEEVSASAEEQLAVTESVEQSARGLSDLSARLKDAASRFRLS